MFYGKNSTGLKKDQREEGRMSNEEEGLRRGGPKQQQPGEIRGVENSPGAAKPHLGRAGLTRILLEVTCLAREPPVLVKASHAQSLLESRGLN